MRREVESPQRKVRLELFRLAGNTGTPILSEGQYRATETDNGVGDYTLTFTEPFARIPVVTATTLTADCILQIVSVSITEVRLAGFDATDGTTPKEFDAHILVAGADVADEI